MISAALASARADPRGRVEVTIGPDAEEQWLTGLNDARLIIGTMLRVTEDSDVEYARDDPRFDAGILYHWLGLLQEDLLEVFLDEIGEGGTDDPAPS